MPRVRLSSRNWWLGPFTLSLFALLVCAAPSFGKPPIDWHATGRDIFAEAVSIPTARDRAAVWHQWIADPERHIREHRGDQDFLNAASLVATAWQDAFPGAVCSYKMNW